MTSSVRAALSEAADRLTAVGVESGRADAEALLAWVTGTPRSRLHALSCLSDEAEIAFRAALARRQRREPLQHITGRAAFRHLDLTVGPGVFIPRPETEVMAGVAIDELRSLVKTAAAEPLAVDLCSGSGAVAVAMATEAAGCRVVAVELSMQAADYASRNAAGSAVEVRCGDIADAVDDLVGQAQVVTANPPYIPMAAYESVALEARQFDPPLALWADDDGMQMVRTVAEVAARVLVGGGLVLCEHADVQGDSAPAVFAASGHWVDVRDCRDLAGRPRFVRARRAPRSSGEPGTITR